MRPVRIIPCLDMKNGRVVKGVHFVELKDVADPVAAARAYSDGGADEIAFLDITATVEGRQTMFDVARRVAEVVQAPLTVGGGIKTVADVEEALDAGASAVSISSAAFRDPEMVKNAVKKFGSKAVIVAIDADANDRMPSKREVFIDGGRTATGRDAVEFSREMADLGVGQILPGHRGRNETSRHCQRRGGDARGLLQGRRGRARRRGARGVRLPLRDVHGPAGEGVPEEPWRRGEALSGRCSVEIIRASGSASPSPPRPAGERVGVRGAVVPRRTAPLTRTLSP
jgi:imidazoleglycerol phosphate synthase cyclase subunit